MRRAASSAVALLLLVGLTSGCSRYHGMTERDADLLISKELPPGTDAARVIAFLDARGFEHSELREVDAEFFKYDSFFYDLKPEQKNAHIKGLIAAKIPDVSQGFLTNWDIFLRFYFDEDGKLVAHQAKTIGTGP